MVGRLEERNYESVRSEYESDQSLLADYCDTDETLIAVVSKPGDTNIDTYCDEHWPELGMPEWALNKFWKVRTGYRTNSAVEHPHNKAYEDVGLDGIYHSHLRTEEAEKRLQEAVRRLNSGEDLTLVCFEKEGERCHRHILIDVMESRRKRESKFNLSA